jgi:hypothetical protein
MITAPRILIGAKSGYLNDLDSRNRAGCEKRAWSAAMQHFKGLSAVFP